MHAARQKRWEQGRDLRTAMRAAMPKQEMLKAEPKLVQEEWDTDQPHDCREGLRGALVHRRNQPIRDDANDSKNLHVATRGEVFRIATKRRRTDPDEDPPAAQHSSEESGAQRYRDTSTKFE